MVIALYPPIHIDETNLPEMQFLINKYCNENCIDLYHSQLAFCYQSYDWCEKYGLFREMDVIKWLLRLSLNPINFWIDNKDLDTNFCLLSSYIINCCGKVIFFDGENHPEWEFYISEGYRNRINIHTSEYKELHKK